MLSDPHIVTWIILTFLLAGTVKGVVGSGLPTVSLGVLTAVIGLHPAMALMLAPTIVTNVWQALVGGHFRTVLVRAWPFFLVATASIWLGAMALTRVNVSVLSALLGLLLAVYGALGLFARPMTVTKAAETWAGLVAGFFNGAFGGMTGAFAFPGVPYLQALGLTRDQLIQAMGMLFTTSTVALALALSGQKLLSVDIGLASVLAILPALAGMVLGQQLRRRLSEARFRRVFFSAQIALGGYIVLRAVV
ncbi:MAG: TSUP family transporter [Rhizobiales bacterium]|nr:TSUP family transporter [Hyphomicrobiales bacterium]